MTESFRTRIFRWFFNLFPAYRGTGGRITYIARNFREVWDKVASIRFKRPGKGTLYAVVEKTVHVRLEQDRGLREGGSA